MDPVKISSLELENVKRVRAVTITPTQDGLTVIGGRNAQGKTSVLDGIAWALGGKKMMPDNPNRDGAATPAKLHVELSNGITVERRGKNGTLYVTDMTGRKGTQKLLDEFLSALALDLPKFLGGTDKDRTTALLQTLGIDEQLAALDGQIKSAYVNRQAMARQKANARAHADKLPHYDDAPEEPVSVAELVQQQQAILARNGENQRKRQQVTQLQAQYKQGKRGIAAQEDFISRLEEQIKTARATLEQYKADNAKVGFDLMAAQKTAEQLQDESTAEIQASIANIESINQQVAANQRKAEAVAQAVAVEAQYDDYTKTIESLREQRIALLDGAPLPLPGLSVDEEGRLTYQGQTWSDMSGAEQLRVATAIVRATKPECGFVLVDKLEQFDTQQLAEFGAWAQNEGLQVIGTRVSTGGECTIIIEDGMVEDAPTVVADYGNGAKIVAMPVTQPVTQSQPSTPAFNWSGAWGGANQ